MSTLYEKVVSEKGLWQAWEKVRSNNGACGVDRQTVEHFAKAASQNISSLCRKLLEGNYRWQPLKLVKISKSDGSIRVLKIPVVKDRVIQTAMAQALSPVLEPEMEPCSYAYRPGRSVKMAVEKVSLCYQEGYRWIVDADIDDYFDNVPHKILLQLLQKYFDDPGLLAMISSWLEASSPQGIGLPQGSPLSPLLSNIYLDELDEKIQGKGVRLVRYADDFLLLCKSSEKARNSLDDISLILNQLGLKLHPDKTEIVSFDQGFAFLGHLFLRSLSVKQTWDEPEEEIKNKTRETQIPDIKEEVAEKAQDTGAELEELSPRLRILYLTGKGRSLEMRNCNFSILENDREDAPELLALQPQRIDRIELWPGTLISLEAQKVALKENIQMAFVNGRGETLGNLDPVLPRKADLHLEQAGTVLRDQSRLKLARLIVKGKLRNQRALLTRLNRRRKNQKTLEVISKLKRVIKDAEKATAVPQLMGYEGEGAKYYWAALGKQIEAKWNYKGRNRRPPKDPLNVIISFTSWLLYRDLRCLVVRHGLHPGFGALHSSVSGRDGCVSDLIEEFRAPLSEGLAVYLVNNRIIKQRMFLKTEEEAFTTLPEGRDQIIRSYEDWLDRAIRSRVSGNRVKWRGILEEQVLAYRNHICGKEQYTPYRMDY